MAPTVSRSPLLPAPCNLPSSCARPDAAQFPQNVADGYGWCTGRSCPDAAHGHQGQRALDGGLRLWILAAGGQGLGLQGRQEQQAQPPRQCWGPQRPPAGIAPPPWRSMEALPVVQAFAAKPRVAAPRRAALQVSAAYACEITEVREAGRTGWGGTLAVPISTLELAAGWRRAERPTGTCGKRRRRRR